MNKLPITQNFSQDPIMVVGSFDAHQYAHGAWEQFIRGELVLAPSFVKRPDGRLEILELSLIPRGTEMPVEARAELIEKLQPTPERFL